MTSLPERFQEDRELACRELIFFIEKARPEERAILLRDLAFTCAGLSLEARLNFALTAALAVVEPTTASILHGIAKGDVSRRQDLSVGFVTILPTELKAARGVLGLAQQDPTSVSDGFRYWVGELPQTLEGTARKFVLTMVGAPRNVNCAAACAALFRKYRLDLCILIGIGAGIRDRCAIGDVVASEAVIDYEGARLEPGRVRARPHGLTLSPRLRRHLAHFEEEDHWRSGIAQLLANQEGATGWQPKLQSGVVLSGEKLVADGSLEVMRSEFHERTRALDQESSGFAQACEEAGVPWIVFRAISDFGDPQTKDAEPGTRDRKQSQLPAAMVAAVCALQFAIDALSADESEF
jgi:nucleoside phosphorylase